MLACVSDTLHTVRRTSALFPLVESTAVFCRVCGRRWGQGARGSAPRKAALRRGWRSVGRIAGWWRGQT